jgi:hypothetical protein
MEQRPKTAAIPRNPRRRPWGLVTLAYGGCLIDSTRELLGTVFGLSAIFVILCLVRRPYGLHAIPAIIQTHASHKARRPIACEP